MYISRVYIRNYKNFKEFDLYIPDGNPLTIIGGNNSGKTNFLQAIRLVLDTSIPPWERKLAENDFSWDCEDNCWKDGEEVVITVTFSNVVNKEEIQAFLYSLSPTEVDTGDLTEELNLEANISFVFAPTTFNKNKEYDIVDDYISFLIAGKYHPSGYYYSGDGSIEYYEDSVINELHGCKEREEFYKYFYLSTEDIEKIIKDPASTFEKQLMRQAYSNKIRKHINLLALDALRDVKNDFYSGYNSLVSQLIRAGTNGTKKGYETSKEITEAFKQLRTSGQIPKTNELLEIIEGKLQNKDVNLLAERADLIVGSPNVTIDTIGKYFNFLVNLKEELKNEQEMQSVGLGYQNLAYISAVLALFELKKDMFSEKDEESINIVYNLLLIEEPEAHLDVQNQKYLHTQFENKTARLIELSEENSSKAYSFTQVIQTSHSTHLASKSSLQNLVVIQRGAKQARAINIDATLKQDPESYAHNRRIVRQYLDATRSALLFARKVILVEGLSEKYALGSIVNIYLQQKNKENIPIDIDSKGIEIVEIGGKTFDSFNALFNNDPSKGLAVKCLNLRDGDAHLEKNKVNDYNQKYSELNKISTSDVTEATLIKKNIYTFEIDTFFLPDPNNPEKDNLDYLKLILTKFMQDGDYFKKPGTFEDKLEKIDEFKKLITSNDVNQRNFDTILSSIMGHEVSKPSIALYLASLLKAKLLNDKNEEDSWTKGNISNAEFHTIKYETLQDFVIPKYIDEGITWLITN